jgi:aspartyl-tRNA synthetase
VLRTHQAGTLRAGSQGHVGQSVVLTGWVARRRDHGGVAFLDLRDASGVAQVVVRDEVLEQGDAHDLRNEYCIKVTGEVRVRPEGNANADLPTGEIEVVAEELEVLSAAGALPFQIDERVTACGTATWTCADQGPARPGPTCGCAAGSTRPRARCSPSATSSRWRRRR